MKTDNLVRWGDVIYGSTKLMQRFVLTIEDHDNSRVSEIFQFRRKFVSVSVTTSEERWMERRTMRQHSEVLLAQVLQHLAPNIMHLHLERVKLNQPDLALIYRNMPELITITFFEVYVIRTDFQGWSSPVVLQKLTKLSASHSPWLLLEMISVPNLTYLHIEGLNIEFDPIAFLKFSETAKHLKTLIIHTSNDNAIYPSCSNVLVFYETLSSIKPELLPALVTLEIRSVTNLSCDPLRKFLSGRSNTLTKLTLGWVLYQSNEAVTNIFRVIFNDLKYLKELSMLMWYCPDNELDWASIKLNKSIKSLYIGECHNKLFEHFLSICTGLESLMVDELTEDRAQYIFNNLNLSKLTVKTDDPICKKVKRKLQDSPKGLESVVRTDREISWRKST